MTEKKQKEEEAQADNLINDANAAAERLEKANAELARLLAQQQEQKIKDMQGGSTEAGNKEETEEEKKKKEEIKAAQSLIAGTGLEIDF